MENLITLRQEEINAIHELERLKKQMSFYAPKEKVILTVLRNKQRGIERDLYEIRKKLNSISDNLSFEL